MHELIAIAFGALFGGSLVYAALSQWEALGRVTEEGHSGLPAAKAEAAMADEICAALDRNPVERSIVDPSGGFIAVGTPHGTVRVLWSVRGRLRRPVIEVDERVREFDGWRKILAAAKRRARSIE
jgi:hypothetical protein